MIRGIFWTVFFFKKKDYRNIKSKIKENPLMETFNMKCQYKFLEKHHLLFKEHMSETRQDLTGSDVIGPTDVTFQEKRNKMRGNSKRYFGN